MKPIRAVLLDMDDTVYPERSYFESGMAAVAQLVAGESHSVAVCLAGLKADVAQHGRVGVIDRIPVPDGTALETWRLALLHRYRTHAPTLPLFPDVLPFMTSCRQAGYRLGLITDGKSAVQWRKLQALGLDKLVDIIVVTDDIDAPKPSSKPFALAAQLLGVPPGDAVYIADDASKDFIGPHELGMATIQIMRGLAFPLAKPAATPDAEAQYRVTTLLEAASLLFGDTP